MGNGLVNCKKCGALFFKNSGREICEECFKKELETIDNIKIAIKNSEKEKIPLEELPELTGVDIDELRDLVIRGRLFAVLPKISIKCRFCGIDLENDEKTGFTCKKCLLKFSPKANELEKKGISINKYLDEAKTLKRRLRGGFLHTSDNSNRYGFIQNYDL